MLLSGSCVQRAAIALVFLGGALLLRPAATLANYANFETVPARPLALSPDGARLFATNTPDGRLEVFDITASGLLHRWSVAVGMEPVAVAARSNGEVWVVNYLSDSVSVVDLMSDPPRVTHTLHVGDEPWDVVFGGSADANGVFPRAFVSAARRGQNHKAVPHPKTEITTPGVGRADVWVFDATALGSSLGGDPIAIVQLFGDKPRPLAVSPDGSTVYAGIFHSGNRTTTVSEDAVCNGGASAAPCQLDDSFTMPGGMADGFVPGGLPAPNENWEGTDGPEVGLIVQFDPTDSTWQDELGRNWNNAVRFSLPDLDVFAIDADANTPVQTAEFAGVGTVLFAMAPNPANDKLYVANTEARNEVRFEGTGNAGQNSTVRGRLHQARITVIDGSNVTPRHLNKHIPYGTHPVPAGVEAASLATPTALAVSAEPNQPTSVYVAAFGSSEVGVFDATALENDTFTPDPNDHIAITGGGPAGIVLDPARDRAYVYTRFDDGISILDTTVRVEVDHVLLNDPEPAVVTAGRHILYDAVFTSSNGEASCSACHVFSDMDDLAWDLGDPNGTVKPNNNPFPITGAGAPFHPMKGPMSTQTLRALADHGPMHWRGDRSGAQSPGDPNALNEDLAFKAFNVAFSGLLGRDEGPLAAPDMQAFTDFILTVILPPNPIRNLNNSLTSSELAGRSFFLTRPASDGVATCTGCHTLDLNQGFFGTDGGSSFEAETQEFKVPQLRNMYQKIGMFGMPQVGGILAGDNGNKGDQIRGFGFTHDGSVDTMFRFHRAVVFAGGSGFGGMPNPDQSRRDMEAYMHVFDTSCAPIVGQQVTLSASSGTTENARIDLLRQRAQTNFVRKGPDTKECELVVKGTIGGVPRGWLLNATGGDYSDDDGDVITDAALRALAATPGQELTWTCVYPTQGTPTSGTRLGLDRDLDGIRDGEQCGDVNGDGLVRAADPRLVRMHLAGLLPNLTTPAKCNVIGDPGGDESTCTIVDVALLERKVASLGPPLSQICGPAL